MTEARATLDPRLRVLYLVGIAVGVFFLREPWQVLVAVALQVALWTLLRLGARRLLRQVTRLWGFAVFIVGTYALSTLDGATDRWVEIPWLWGLEINLPGLAAGGVMVLRIITVVLASQVTRAGDPRAIAAGLRKLGLPRMASVSIDTVLALFSETGKGGGRGGGGGGGRGRGRGGGADGDEGPHEGFWASFKRLARGDVKPILARLERQIRRAEDHAGAELGDAGRPLARDIGIIAGVSLTMLGIRALKVLPSIPFAPGHKGVILIPLYVVASRLTRSKLGGTLTGLTMGTVAFLMGDGRYGIFELVKHVAPGLICDVALPVFAGGGRRPGPIAWSIYGGLVAAGRFATIFTVTLLVQAPAFAFKILIPGLTIHVSFGILSGYVTYHLMRGLDELARSRAHGATEESP